MPLDMILDEAGDEEIGVIIARMHAVHRGCAGFGQGGGKGPGHQLVEELVVRTLIDQHVALPAPRAEEVAGIMLFPLLAILAEIGAKLLLPPVTLDGVCDWRKGRDRAVELRLA